MIKAPSTKRGFLTMDKLIQVVLILLLTWGCLIGGEVIVVCDRIGAEIDPIENEYYGVFPDIKNFLSAQFYLLPNDSVMAFIQYWDEQSIQIQKISFSQFQVYLIGQRISLIPPPSAEQLEKLQDKYQPLFAEKYLAEIPINSYCIIKLKDKTIKRGYFYQSNRDFIRLGLAENQFCDVALGDILRMKYYDDQEEQQLLFWSTITGVSVVGMAGGVAINYLIDVPITKTLMFPFSGAIVGVVVGYKLTPIVINWLRPKTIIEFRKNKIKRLDFVGRLTYTFKKWRKKYGS
jgi:hypothetical protein